MRDDEWIEERAAILEFEAGLSRKDADKQALEMWKKFDSPREKTK